MILESDLLHAASSLVQLGLLEVLSVGSHKVESTPRVRIASISVDAVSFRFAANELIGWLGACDRLMGADRIWQGAWCLYLAQVDAIVCVGRYIEPSLVVDRDLASIVGWWQAASLHDPIVGQDDAPTLVLNRAIIALPAHVKVHRMVGHLRVIRVQVTPLIGSFLLLLDGVINAANDLWQRLP